MRGGVDAAQRYRLAGPAAAHPFEARPGDDGRLRLSDRVRAAASAAFFEDRLEPVDVENSLATVGDSHG